METDYAENHDLADQHPDILATIAANFTTWYNTIQDSRVNESKCGGAHPTPGPKPAPVPFPTNYTPSSACTFLAGKRFAGPVMAIRSVPSKEACCGAGKA